MWVSKLEGPFSAWMAFLCPLPPNNMDVFTTATIFTSHYYFFLLTPVPEYQSLLYLNLFPFKFL